MWSDKPYRLPRDSLQVFDSDPFFELLNLQLRIVVCDKPTYPQILLEAVSIISSLIEPELKDTVLGEPPDDTDG
jgi:hypothetical protein